MKTLLIIFALFFTGHAWSDVTITWIPGEVVDGTPVDQWLLFCANVNNNYDEQNPVILPEVDRSHTLTLADGATKCMMRSRSNNNIWNQVGLDSVNSEETTFLVAGGVNIDPRPNAPSLAVN